MPAEREPAAAILGPGAGLGPGPGLGARGDLARYDERRDFERTPEPRGAVPGAPSPGPIFVIQMHRASRLHYDFRLEADGVLKSWAVPKGPSLDTREKRLAMRVEDHPYDYHDFEGVIPEGNYGAGEVIVWDRGTYRLLEGESTTAQIAKGSLKFELHGEKLHGGFALVHIKGRGGEENAWLLIKERDDAVDPAWRAEQHDASAVTGKTLRDLARDPSAPHWESRPSAAARRTRGVRRAAAEHVALPPPFEPMLAYPADAAFDDARFGYEIKWDGYRALARIERDGSFVLQSRGGIDFASKFEEFAGLAASFGERPLIVDGEICVLDDRGYASFGALQTRLDRFGRRRDGHAATFVAFDCCFGNGRDLRDEPLSERKGILASLLTGAGPVMLSKHVERDGIALFDLARAQHVEGIVAKRLDSPYRSRRSRDWLKIKTALRQEFVIGGWTAGRSGRKHFGSLLLGVYDGDELCFTGAAGTGFDGRSLASTAALLDPLARATSPFGKPPKTETKAHWVEPRLVAEVSFAEWTRDGILRQPVFLGLRDDKDPRTVAREAVFSALDAARRPDAGDAAAPEPASTPVASPPPASPPKKPARVATRKTSETSSIGGRSIALTNRDKILFPADGITKGDLVAYYRAVAPWLLPHLTDRPLTTERFPDGIEGQAFYEKHKPRGVPEWVPTVKIPSDQRTKGGDIEFVLCNDEATLAYIANLGAIVLHVWTSHVPALDVPEFVFFDLDPWEGCTLATLAKTALGLRDLLAEAGLAALVKTSGGTGLHVAIPLEPAYGYDDVKVFAEIAARTLHDRLPALTTLERATAKRPAGTVYLDYVQVGRGKTLVSAFSVRARAGAPVSMPIAWTDVEAMTRSRAPDATEAFGRYTLRTVPALLAAGGDAWAGAAWQPQRLEAAIERAREAWARKPARRR